MARAKRTINTSSSSPRHVRSEATRRSLTARLGIRALAFVLGFAIMLGAELNAAIQEEWPASTTHANRVRAWLKRKAGSLNGDGEPPEEKEGTAAPQAPDAKTGLPTPPAGAGLPTPPAGTDAATS